jgi:hypothetical protein
MNRRPLPALCLAALLLAPGVHAQPAEPAFQVPHRDPWVPPASRVAPLAEPTTGEALRAQVRAKLRAQFEAADRQRSGSLTHEQARAAGLGVVAQNFSQIDHQGTGRVSFDDLVRYLRSRGGAL